MEKISKNFVSFCTECLPSKLEYIDFALKLVQNTELCKNLRELGRITDWNTMYWQAKENATLCTRLSKWLENGIYLGRFEVFTYCAVYFISLLVPSEMSWYRIKNIAIFSKTKCFQVCLTLQVPFAVNELAFINLFPIMQIIWANTKLCNVILLQSMLYRKGYIVDNNKLRETELNFPAAQFTCILNYAQVQTHKRKSIIIWLFLDLLIFCPKTMKASYCTERNFCLSKNTLEVVPCFQQHLFPPNLS